MEPKKAKAGAMASAAGLSLADKQIQALCAKVLPPMPHLLSVPTKTPYMPVFPHENQSTPFAPWEVMQLQYMTLISNGDRGVGYTEGNWEDSVNAKSPQSSELPSSTPTPNPVRDSKKPPAVKMSIADYKSLKTTGTKPSPRPSAATPESRPRNDVADRHHTHVRNTSNISIHTPMARVPSFEGGDSRLNGVGANSRQDKAQQGASSKEDRLLPPRSKGLESKETDKPRSTVNGNLARDSLASKDGNKDPRPRPDTQNTIAKEVAKHSLPPRPQFVPESKKRPNESGDAQPEKRQRIEPSHSNSTKPVARNVEEPKPSPVKLQRAAQNTSSHASPPPKKSNPSNPRPIETKGHSSKSSISEKPLNLPPLLSPLPADLETPPQSSSESLRKPDSSKPLQARTPKVGPDTIIVKGPQMKKDQPTSSPLSTLPKSPPFILPRLLSPNLPDIVEAELQRLQQKSATLNTVEARHEKARQPGALGVAQRRPKVGHPPKKPKDEASSSAKKTAVVDKERLLVKIPYKKRDSKRIQDLLRLKPKPSKEFRTLEAQRIDRERSTSAVPPPKGDSDSEEDIPIVLSRAAKGPAQTISRKRPTESSDSPAPKRAKLPEAIDVAKASTPLAQPFKSPLMNGSNVVRDFGLLATPKKGDAMKSVAMRKVDSQEGHARTPQPASTSTPASAEKSRPRVDKVIDHESLAIASAEEKKFFPIGTDYKRHMQAVIFKKDATAAEKKEAIMRGIEGIMAYMITFHFRDRVDSLQSRRQNPQGWEGFFPVWNFVETNSRNIPELHALVEQLGAVSREQLDSLYGELAPEIRNEPRMNDRFNVNHTARKQLWIQCKKNKNYLRDLGLQDTLEPASSVREAVGFGVATLWYFANKEGMKWEGDSNFSSPFTKTFMKASDAALMERKTKANSKPKDVRDVRDVKDVPEEIAALVS